MVGRLSKIRGWFDRWAPQRDWLDWITLFALCIVLSLTFPRSPLSVVSVPFPGTVIAIFSAGSVFYAQYRLRHPNKDQVPAVRPEYASPYSENQSGYVLKNFGPGPALYLQIKACVGENSNSEESHEENILLPKESPMHLEEGENISLTSNRIKDSEGNHPLHSLVKQASDDVDKIYLHYSYLAQNGVREPRPAKRIAGSDADNILNDLPVPDNRSSDGRFISVSKTKSFLEEES